MAQDRLRQTTPIKTTPRIKTTVQSSIEVQKQPQCFITEKTN